MGAEAEAGAGADGEKGGEGWGGEESATKAERFTTETHAQWLISQAGWNRCYVSIYVSINGSEQPAQSRGFPVCTRGWPVRPPRVPEAGLQNSGSIVHMHFA